MEATLLWSGATPSRDIVNPRKLMVLAGKLNFSGFSFKPEKLGARQKESLLQLCQGTCQQHP